MDKPLIYLAFTDDWELRIQFAPMRLLLDIFEKHGMRCTFMAEMMQQLTFRARQAQHLELKPLADAWDKHVLNAHGRGHDVQLHLHTQWSDTSYDGGKWRLGGSWSILNYEPVIAQQMIEDGKAYLEHLLQPADPKYKCVAFRASYLAVAPSPTLLSELARQGIEIESSIVGGLRVDTDDVQFDYTPCDEDFQPYYPQMTDARRVSNRKEPIVCVPIFHFTGSRLSAIRQIASKVGMKLTAKGASDSYRPLESSAGRAAITATINEKVVKPLLFGKHHTADASRLDLSLLREMLSAIRSRAKGSGLEQVPVVVTNHSKYMNDFDGFDRFLGEVAAAADIKTITMTELAAMLRAGEFEIKKV
jgi:hypothetical protein